MAFICGCGHSGTTLLATMLSCHRSIYLPTRETSAFLRDEARQERELRRLKDRALSAGKNVVVEKTPAHIRQIDKMRARVRGARFILMSRDGRDVTASLANRNGGDFEAGLTRWVGDNAHLISQLSKPDVLLLRYEDLITDPEKWLRKVCSFLQLPFDSQMLRYHEREVHWFGVTEIRKTGGVGEEHQALRNWQVNQPLFDGRGRWKTDLPPDFIERFRAGVPRRTMSSLGYDLSGFQTLLHPHPWSGRGGSAGDKARRLMRRAWGAVAGRGSRRK